MGNGTYQRRQFQQSASNHKSLTSSSHHPLPSTLLALSAGVLGSGTVGVAFTSAVANFTINQGSTAWAIDDILRFQVGYQRTTQTGTGNGKMQGLMPDPTMTTVLLVHLICGLSPSQVATAFTVSGSTRRTARWYCWCSVRQRKDQFPHRLWWYCIRCWRHHDGSVRDDYTRCFSTWC
jgi:hypothetical protein